VHCVASSLLMVSSSSGEGAERRVTVANLADFRSSLRLDLEQMLPGETRQFPKELTELQRKAIHLVSAELGFQSTSTGEGLERFVTVRRPSPDGEDEAKRNGNTVDFDDETSSQYEGEGETEHLIRKLFDSYATGNWRGNKIFLRFPDLKHFAEDVKDIAPRLHRVFSKYSCVLESTFDDTLQLQIDFGTRTNRGLTMRWFQVFVQKTLKKLGLEVTSFLFALHDARQ